MLDSTVVPRMAEKFVELIVHARYEWPINQSQGYQPWKDENLGLYILGLVHKSRN